MTRKRDEPGLWAALRRWFAAMGSGQAQRARTAGEIDGHLAASLPVECVSAVLRNKQR